MNELSQSYRPMFSDQSLARLSERFPRFGAYAQESPRQGFGAERAFGVALAGVEVVGTATTMSVFNSRADAKNGTRGHGARVLGAPIDLCLGLGTLVLAAMGYFGEHGGHAANFGIGFLAATGVRWGTSWGGELLPAAGAGAPMHVGGPPPGLPPPRHARGRAPSYEDAWYGPGASAQPGPPDSEKIPFPPQGPRYPWEVQTG